MDDVNTIVGGDVAKALEALDAAHVAQSRRDFENFNSLFDLHDRAIATQIVAQTARRPQIEDDDIKKKQWW